FEWLEVFDSVEGTSFHRDGPPRQFLQLSPLLRRFFARSDEETKGNRGVTLVIDFPEKIIPASDHSAAFDERMALVTLLKWAASDDVRRLDVGILLLTESANEIHSDLLRNPHVGQVRVDLPDAEERAQFLRTELDFSLSDLDETQLAART